MAIESVATTITENDYPVRMPNGDNDVLLVPGESSYEKRQNLASCLLSVVKDPTSQTDDDSVNNNEWTVAYIVTIAKALLDSMDLRDRGGAA